MIFSSITRPPSSCSGSGLVGSLGGLIGSLGSLRCRLRRLLGGGGLRGRLLRARRLIGCRLGCSDFCFGRFAHAELAGLRRFLGQLLLHRVAHGDPAALGAGHRALDQDEAALDVGLHDLEIERGDALDAQVARHLLVLEGLARVLTAAGATDRAVRDRHAVRGAQAARNSSASCRRQSPCRSRCRRHRRTGPATK